MTGPVAVEELFPILVSADLPALQRFWVDGLGARPTYRFPPEGDPVFVGLDLGSQHLGLGHAPADQPWGERTARLRDPSGTDLVLGQRLTTD